MFCSLPTIFCVNLSKQDKIKYAFCLKKWDVVIEFIKYMCYTINSWNFLFKMVAI